MSDVPKKEESTSGTTKEDLEEESVIEPSTPKDQHPPTDEETVISDKSIEEEPKSGPNVAESTHEDQEQVIDYNSDQEPDRPGHMPRGRIKPPVSGSKPPSRPK